MDLEWPGHISIPERAITVIIGSSSVLEEGLNSCSGTMRRYPFLYACSNYSGVLPNLHRTTFEFSVRRGFTLTRLPRSSPNVTQPTSLSSTTLRSMQMIPGWSRVSLAGWKPSPVTKARWLCIPGISTDLCDLLSGYHPGYTFMQTGQT